MQNVDAMLSVISKSFIEGLAHGLNIFDALAPLSDRTILISFLKVAGVNVLVIIGSDIGVLQRMILPLCRYYGCHLYDFEYGSPAFEETNLPIWVEQMASVLYHVGWLFPIWMLIYAAVSIPGYAELAGLIHDRRFLLAKKPLPQSTQTVSIEEETYRHVFFAFLLVQKYVLLALPSVAAATAAVISSTMQKEDTSAFPSPPPFLAQQDPSCESVASSNRWVWEWTSDAFIHDAPPDSSSGSSSSSSSSSSENSCGGDGGYAYWVKLSALCLYGLTHCAVYGALLVAFVFSMLLSSLYAFEYAWATNGGVGGCGRGATPSATSSSSSSSSSVDSNTGVQSSSAPSRHAQIEQSWPYFLGFGLPLTLLTTVLVDKLGGGVVTSLALNAAFFPLAQMQAAGFTALEGAASAHQQSVAFSVPRLPVLAPSFALVENLAATLFELVKGKKASHLASHRHRVQNTRAAAEAAAVGETAAGASASKQNQQQNQQEQQQPPSEQQQQQQQQQVTQRQVEEEKGGSSGQAMRRARAPTRKFAPLPTHLRDDLARGRIEAAARERAAARNAVLSGDAPSAPAFSAS
jgi:hypothetical protein